MPFRAEDAVSSRRSTFVVRLPGPSAWAERERGFHERIEPIARDAVELFEVGEEGIALENLVENLYEFAIPLDAPLLAEIRWLCEELRVDTSALTAAEPPSDDAADRSSE